VEGSLPEEWQAATDIHISEGSLGGIYLSSLNLRGSGGTADALEIFFEGTAPSGGFLEGSLLAPEFPRGELGVSFSGTSLDLALGEMVDSRLAFLSGIVPSLRGSYLRKDGSTSGSLIFSDVRGSYGDLSFEKFHGAVTLSQDRIESSLEGLLENLPLTGGGTVQLTQGEPPAMDLFLRSPGTPLHRLRAILPDLEPFLLEGNLAWEIFLRGSPQNPLASGKLHSERIRIRGELLESLETAWQYEKEIFSLQKARVSWKDVLLEGDGEIRDLFQSREMAFHASALPRGNRWAREILSQELREFCLPLEGGKISLNLKGTPESFQGSLSGILPPLQTPLGTTGRGSLKASLGPNKIEISSLELPLASGGLSLKGTLARSSSGAFHPSLKGEIRHIPLDPLESSGIPLKGLLEGTFQVRGSLESPELGFSLSSPEITFQEYRGKALSCQGNLSPETLRIEEARVRFWEGEAVLRGTLAPLKTNPKLDFQGNFAKIDLMGTQDLLDEAKIYLKGIAGGTLVITGTPESPQITLEITSPKILVNSLPLEDVSGTLGISPQEIRMDPLVVHAGSSPVTISTVVLPEKSWESSFSATSDSLDLASLLQSWELASPETPFFPRGKLRLRVQGNVRNGRLLGQGNISSPELSAGTLRGEKIHLPFVFDENTFTLQESSLSFYQGILRGEGTINYAEKPALWKAHLWGEDIQISPFLRDLHPLSGDISGTGAFDLTLKGPLNYLFMTNGEGHITVREGAFSEFPQLAPLLAKAPQPQLDFASLQVYFSVDGRTLYFVPGSRLTAPPGNPIYRYFAADGFLPFTGRPMNINCITEINAPAINAFLGAFAGFLETVFLTKDISQLGSLTNLTQAVEDALLGGIFGGLAKSDFREISFSLKGTMEKPEMANLSIAPKQGAFLLNPQDKDKGEKGRDFQLSFSFPTGEGKKTSDDISGQFKDQIFEQAIKQLIPLGD
jgi:translocation and assembly module TamB